MNSLFDISTDLEEFVQGTSIEKIRTLWRSKRKPVLGVDPFEPSGIAEGLIQGGKEFGKSLLKGVSGRNVNMLALKYRFFMKLEC